MLDTAAQIARPPDEQEGVSLSTLLTRVRGVVKEGFAEAVWVRAELRKVSPARSGHV